MAVRSLPLLLGLRYLTRLYAHSLGSQIISVICLSDKRGFLRVLKIMYKFPSFVSCKRTYKTYDLILPTNFLFSVQTRKKLRAANKIFQICLSCVYIQYIIFGRIGFITSFYSDKQSLPSRHRHLNLFLLPSCRSGI